MNWIEVIRLRVPPGKRSGIVKEFETMLAESGPDSDTPPEVRTYLNLFPGGDIAMVLFWNRGGTDPQGSRMALSLLAGLKNTGLINHSVWVEASPQSAG